MSRFIEKKNHLSHHIKNIVEIAEERKSIFLEEYLIVFLLRKLPIILQK